MDAAEVQRNRLLNFLTFIAIGLVLHALYCLFEPTLGLTYFRFSMVAAGFFGLIAAWMAVMQRQREWHGLPEKSKQLTYGTILLVVGTAVWIQFFVGIIFGLPQWMLKYGSHALLPIHFLINGGLTVALVRAWKGQNRRRRDAIGEGSVATELSRGMVFIATIGVLLSWLLFGLLMFRLIDSGY